MTNATLHLFSGKAASGKSTLAAAIAERENAALLSEDRFLAALFGDQLKTLDDYGRLSRKLRQSLEPHILQLLGLGMSVVLDFPANTLGQRRWMRGLIDAAGCPHVLHLLEVSDEECKVRLRDRNESGGNPFKLTEEQFEAITAYFIPPTDEEGFTVLRHGGADSRRPPA